MSEKKLALHAVGVNVVLGKYKEPPRISVSNTAPLPYGGWVVRVNVNDVPTLKIVLNPGNNGKEEMMYISVGKP